MITKLRNEHFSPIIVFSDLDDTYTIHTDGAFDAPLPALEAIKRLDIPLIMCTGRTRREAESIQMALKMKIPFIVENGGAIYFPPSYAEFSIPESVGWHGYKAVILGMPYARIRAFMDQIRTIYPLRGFGDMQKEEISALTGLPVDQAALAMEREFSEPFLFEDIAQASDLADLAKEIGIKLFRGERYWCLAGKDADEAFAVRLTKQIFVRNSHEKLITIGMGRCTRDIAMLAEVDIPLLVPHPDGSYEDIDLPHIIMVPYPENHGWKGIILELVHEHMHQNASHRRGGQR